MSSVVRYLRAMVLVATIVANSNVMGHGEIKYCGRNVPKLIIIACEMLKKRSTETQALGDLKNLAKKFYIDGLLRELWHEGKLLDSNGHPLNAKSGSVPTSGDTVSLVRGANNEQKDRSDKKAKLNLLKEMLPGLIEMMQDTPQQEHQREVLAEPTNTQDTYGKSNDELVSLLGLLGLSNSGSQSGKHVTAVSENPAGVVKKDFDPLRNDGRLFHYMQTKRDGMAIVSLIDQCCRNGCKLNQLLGICD
ncbi:unnamed protein product [Owenia fusiformis]|uniref:Insulin-like domain-containing protein n=1 Tax=Owenia fusiformis TaxID=6347 RepID=A0A8S4NSX6_OWEFU|nr:unnamed protein product [Owenia fusiformis]